MKASDPSVQYGYDPTFSNEPVNDIEVEPEERDGMPYAGGVGIGPYSIVILSQDN